jgi:hypothetical protein
MHWPDPAQRPRIAEIRQNLTARIAEAEREGWLARRPRGCSRGSWPAAR